MIDPALSGVSETLLVTLYLRAMETQRPDALIKDEKAVELVTCMAHDFTLVPGTAQAREVRK
jgi:O-methyltransferase involved in polyketide biosynthesis